MAVGVRKGGKRKKVSVGNRASDGFEGYFVERFLGFFFEKSTKRLFLLPKLWYTEYNNVRKGANAGVDVLLYRSPSYQAAG